MYPTRHLASEPDGNDVRYAVADGLALDILLRFRGDCHPLVRCLMLGRLLRAIFIYRQIIGR